MREQCFMCLCTRTRNVGTYIKMRDCITAAAGLLINLKTILRVNYKFIVYGILYLSTYQQVTVDASIEFCTASKVQRNKLHIHTLIHVFSPDLGLAYYKLKENVYVISLSYLLTISY